MSEPGEDGTGTGSDQGTERLSRDLETVFETEGPFPRIGLYAILEYKINRRESRGQARPTNEKS